MSELKQHLKELEILSKFEEDQYARRPNYTFTDTVNGQLELDAATMASGKRFYTAPDGTKLPSVTTVLGATQPSDKKKALLEWRKKVGEEEAAKITKEAAQRGSFLHNQVEHYLLADEKFSVPRIGTNNYILWKQMHPLLQRVDNIHLLEGVLYSHRLGTAGRVDCVAEWEGELSIIDFKTSRTEKRKDWITDYFLQETAYALMFGEMYNLKIKKIVTLMAVDHDETRTEGQVFVEYPKDYVEPLLKRLAKYKLMMK